MLVKVAYPLEFCMLKKIKFFMMTKCVTPASFSTAYENSVSSIHLHKDTLFWGQSLYLAELLDFASVSDLGERSEYLMVY
jgi:hypothetical protein